MHGETLKFVKLPKFWTNIIYLLLFYSLFKDAVIAQILHRRMAVHNKLQRLWTETFLA